MSEREFDVVVVGGGPAGEVAAERLAVARGNGAAEGLDVALVESDLLGGECSYWACMPSKALLRPAEVLAEVERIPGAREAVTGELDRDAVLRRRDEVIHDFDDSGQREWVDSRGITLVRGHGRLDGPRRVRVADHALLARQAVVLSPGSGALIPPIPGLREARPWTNREATTASDVPERLVVLGGGVVGVESAQAWASLGSRVTVIEALDRLIAREEPFAGEQVANALAERGVGLHIATSAAAVERGARGVSVTLDSGETVTGDQLLVAVGRTPLTADLGLETLGLTAGETLGVNDQLQVHGHPWLYAVGDVNGRSLLTHMGKYQARIAADHILGRDVAAAHDRELSPRVIFTDPQVAAVGHTLASARERGLDVRAVDHPTGAVAGASFHGRNAPGTARLVIDDIRGVIVGATFTGPEVAELLHGATIAVVAEVPLERLWHAVPAFPTRSEVWLRLMEAAGL